MPHSLMRFFRIGKQFIYREDGAMAVLFIVALPALMAAIAFGIEFSKYLKVEAEAQHALDQALLASVSATNMGALGSTNRITERDSQGNVDREQTRITSRKNIVERFFKLNLGLNKVEYDSNGNAFRGAYEGPRQYITSAEIWPINVQLPTETLPLQVTASARVTYNTTGFASFIGVNELTVTVHSQAQRQLNNVELVLVLPQHGTVCSVSDPGNAPADTVRGDVIYPLDTDQALNNRSVDCERLEIIKSGTLDLINFIRNNDAVHDFKIGVVPYTHKVRIPGVGDTPSTPGFGRLRAGRVPPEWLQQEQPSYFTDFSDTQHLLQILPLDGLHRAGGVRVRDHIRNLTIPADALAWSRTDIATQAAGMILDPARYSDMGGVVRPSDFTGPGKTAMKHIVLLVDGSNLGCCFTNWPDNNFSNQYLYTYQPYHDAQLQICQALKERHVRISSVLVNVDRSTPAGQKIHDTFSLCASGLVEYNRRGEVADCERKGNCYLAESAAEITNALRTVAGIYLKPNLSK